MGTNRATWLADVLRSAGLNVTEEPGWQDRGRPGSFEPKGVICHHTGSNPKGGNLAALSTVRDGRPEDDLHGPLSQLMLGRDGTWHVVAAGRCNHAGKGKWRGITDGNRYFIGVEAENNGSGELWPEAQLESYERGVAALLKELGADDSMVAGHKEYALPVGRKVDPTFDMLHFREDVHALMADKAVHVAIPRTVERTRAMLRKGSQGQSVRTLQRALAKLGYYTRKIDADFGPATERGVKLFQASKGLKVDGLVGPATWAALGIR